MENSARMLAFEKYRRRFNISDEEIEKRLFGTEPDQFLDEAHAEQWDWDIDKYLNDRYPGGMDWLAYRRSR